MSDAKKECPKNEKADEELSDLLESALQDFSKDTTSAEKKTENKPQDNATTAGANDNNAQWSLNSPLQPPPSQFGTDFINQLGLNIDENSSEISTEILEQRLQQIAVAAKQLMANPTAQATENNSTDFASTITQAIQGLSQGTEDLRTPLADDLMRMMSGTPGQENDLMPFMQGMMQGLLSKDVLGPSLQDFVDRLPGYIEENRATLPAEDVTRYENQRKLMQEVLEELNKERETDTVEEKSDRFTKVLTLMQKLQDYGQPPAELVGDVETPFNFDPQGNPMGANPECSVM